VQEVIRDSELGIVHPGPPLGPDTPKAMSLASDPVRRMLEDGSDRRPLQRHQHRSRQLLARATASDRRACDLRGVDPLTLGLSTLFPQFRALVYSLCSRSLVLEE